MSYPKADAEFVIWLKAFAQTFAAHAAALGFTAADVATVQADAAMLDYLIGDVLPSYQSALQARTSYKNLIKDGPVGAQGGDPPSAPVVGAAPATVAPGAVPRLRQLIQRIKNAPNYTESIGQALNIVGPLKDGPGEIEAAKPKFKVVPLAGWQMRIEYTKGRADGVIVEGRRAGESDWVRLGFDTRSPFVDARPPLQPNAPEVREYRLRYMLNDEPVGQWSDIVSATTMP